jgi:excinuclease ABC subunit C
MEQEALISLRAILRTYISLPATFHIHRIEGYDISNIQGTNASCSMVVAIDGKMDSSEYKHFGIKTLKTPNDYGMLQEALLRRQNHPEWGIPDVILIDGGKGQLRSVLSVWKWPSIVVSIAKKPDRLLIPMITQEKIHNKKTTKQLYKEIPLSSDLPATRLLQAIRDESHRFAKRLHTIKRTNSLLY